MGEVLATLESVLAAFHGLDKAGFFLEIARQHILHQVVGIPALPGGRARELRFQVPGDMYFHFVGSISENTARMLGLTRNALHYRLIQMGLEA
jgi:hypothetical protein